MSVNSQLNLPLYNFRTKKEHNKVLLFDKWRKKWIILSREEIVRQTFINYLVCFLNYPEGRLGLEFSIKYHGLPKRPDAVFYDEYGKPLVLIECKAPDVEINKDVLYQALMYNNYLQAKYIFLTNGLKHIAALIDNAKQDIVFLDEIPNYLELR